MFGRPTWRSSRKAGRAPRTARSVRVFAVTAWSSKRPILRGLGGNADIGLGHILGRVVHDDLPTLEEQGPIAKRRDRCQVMTHEDHGVSLTTQATVPLFTARLESGVAHREDLV